MPLIERIKQLLGMGTPSSHTFVASGGMFVNGCADVRFNKITNPKAVFCFKFDINEVVFDRCGNRYIVTAVTAINNNNQVIDSHL